MHSFPIHRIAETDSTNSEILKLAKSTGSQKLVLVADHQTQGRGQFGRKWLSSPKENLLFSIYFEPRIHPAEAADLTQVACRAVHQVLTSHQISCMIKPPNDLLVAGKKICGILTESSTSGEKLEYVVIGIGLNINSPREHLIPEATSMEIEAKKTYDLNQILNELLYSFEKEISSHFSSKIDQIVGG